MAPKTITERITEKFRQLAEAAGLEFITSGDVWLIMDDSDGLDTRLRVKRTFEAEAATFVLSGQAVDRPPAEFFRERSLVRRHNAGSAMRLQLRADYDNGDHMRQLFDVVADLLAPYAVSRTPAQQWVATVLAPRAGELLASRWAAEATLASLGLNQHAIALVLKRAYGHLDASFSYPGSDQLGHVTYDRGQGTYAVRPAAQREG